MLVHCGRGEEVLLGEEYHIFQDEAGGASTLGGVVVHPLPTNETGGLSIEQVVAAIKADDFHNPITRLLSLENTVSGHLQDPEYHRLLAQTVRERGLNVHLDGARLMNAAVALGMPAADICAPFDSVMLCLSKGLGAPVGAMLCGQAEFIRKARRLRKMLGGGMRQAGIIAACGIYALDNNVERLAQDHANARRLAEGIAGIDNLGVECATNMVFIRPVSADHEALREFLRQRQILLGDQRPAMRLVTHLDVSAEQIERVIAEIHNYYQTSPHFSPG
jgi:threonine aldolase